MFDSEQLTMDPSFLDGSCSLLGQEWRRRDLLFTANCGNGPTQWAYAFPAEYAPPVGGSTATILAYP